METGQDSYFEWITKNLPKGSKIGFDATQISQGIICQNNEYAAAFKNRNKYFVDLGFELTSITENLVDLVWAESRPSRPQAKVFIHEVKYAGASVQEKYEKLNAKLDKKVDAYLVTSLDDIAWLLNLRGSDIKYNPVIISYLVYFPQTETNADSHVKLFIDSEKVSDEAVKTHLQENRIEVADYNKVTETLRELVEQKQRIGYDESVCNQRLFEIFEGSEPQALGGLVQAIKAVKTPVEMQGMRNANIKNCVALASYFGWLEDHLKNNPDTDLTEYSTAQKLEDFRKLGDLYVGPSFDSISSIGPNGAVIHYKPKKATALKMNNKEIYLLDSGVQYFDGTTDITRTVHFTEATKEQKEMYTRVLLGTLDVERIVWPSKSTFSGQDFDTLARRHLWAAGVDYGHGTGHGVGTFLCVHEGPIGISRRAAVKFEVGHCVSDEPGYYKDGEYGIRIENVIMVVNHEVHENRLKFENLTVFPYCRELIDKTLLTTQDVDYLNAHNKKCEDILTPYLQSDPIGLSYLQRQCAAL